MCFYRNLYRKSRIYLIASIILSGSLAMSCRLLSLASPTQDLPKPTQEPVIVEPSETPALPTPTAVPPTEVPAPEPPAGFIEYQDSKAGVSVYIPKSWTETNLIEGEYAIFTSYPIDKYVGGEPLESGDTKCDLSIRQSGETIDDLIQQWNSSDMTTILSEQEITLSSGQPGFRFELDSMGRVNILVTDIKGSVVTLTCFGDFTQFDEIAGTLKSVE